METLTGLVPETAHPKGAPALLHPLAPPTLEADQYITIVGGHKATVWDEQGNHYLDARSGAAYCNAGWGERRIIDAIKTQLDSLAGYHVRRLKTNRPAEQLAERISSLAPMPEARVFFVLSGSGSNDTAIQFARLAQQLRGHPEKHLIVSLANTSYHGMTYGALSATGLISMRQGWGELVPGFVQLPLNDLNAFKEFFAEHGQEVAAVILEVVQVSGHFFSEPDFLRGVRQLCDEHGAYLIDDEVICAWGRLGYWFGCEHFDLVPDMVTFGKAVASGYLPLAGVIIGPRLRKVFESDPQFVLRHGFTFSAHPSCCAAGLAAISVYEGLIHRVEHIGEVFSRELSGLQAKGLIRGVRGLGALWAADLHPNQDATEVAERMRGFGVLAWVRNIPNAIGFGPPFVITDDEIEKCIDALARALPSSA